MNNRVLLKNIYKISLLLISSIILTALFINNTLFADNETSQNENGLTPMQEGIAWGVITRIQRGDSQVLKEAIIDDWELTKTAMYCEAEETNSNLVNLLGKRAFNSFLGGLFNPIRELRLEFAFFLGAWVDEVGYYIEEIGQFCGERAASEVEKDEEILLALKLIEIKVARKINLNEVFNGNAEILTTIDETNFALSFLGQREVLRQIHIRLTSPEYLAIMENMRLQPLWRGGACRLRWMVDRTCTNYPLNINEGSAGYRDLHGRFDIDSLRDRRYFVNTTDNHYPNEYLYQSVFEKCKNRPGIIGNACQQILDRQMSRSPFIVSAGYVPGPIDRIGGEWETTAAKINGKVVNPQYNHYLKLTPIIGHHMGRVTYKYSNIHGDFEYYGVFQGNDSQIKIGVFTAHGMTEFPLDIIASNNPKVAIDFVHNPNYSHLVLSDPIDELDQIEKVFINSVENAKAEATGTNNSNGNTDGRQIEIY